MSPAERAALLRKWPLLVAPDKGRNRGRDPLTELSDAIRELAIIVGEQRQLLNGSAAYDAEAVVRERDRIAAAVLTRSTVLVNLTWRLFPLLAFAAGSPIDRAFHRCEPARILDMFENDVANDRPSRFAPRREVERLAVGILILSELGPFFGFRVATFVDPSPLVPVIDHPLRDVIVAEQGKRDAPAHRTADKRQRSLAR